MQDLYMRMHPDPNSFIMMMITAVNIETQNFDTMQLNSSSQNMTYIQATKSRDKNFMSVFYFFIVGKSQTLKRRTSTQCS